MQYLLPASDISTVPAPSGSGIRRHLSLAFFALAFLALGLTASFAPGPASAQNLSLTGGAFVGASLPGETGSVVPQGALSLGVPVTDRFTAEASVSYRDFTAASLGVRADVLSEAAIALSPRLAPYLSLSGGHTVFPDNVPGGEGLWTASAGAGMFYEVSPSISLRAGIEAQSLFSGLDGLSGGLGAAPSFGVVYDFEEPEPEPLSTYSIAPPPVDTTDRMRSPSSSSWGDSGWGDAPRRRTGTPPLGAAEIQGEKSRLPGGMFVMGLTDEDPFSMQRAGRRRVTLSSFMIDRKEVSNAKYRAWLETLSAAEAGEMRPDSSAGAPGKAEVAPEGYFSSSTYAEHPVVSVTHGQAAAYCKAQGGRLPTEAQWEYAARSGYIGRVFPWGGFAVQGEDGGFYANFNPAEGGYKADGFVFTAPVTEFRASAWGLYQMSGNAAEWVRDAWHPSYDVLSDVNPAYLHEQPGEYVVRGGSWSSASYALGVGRRGRESARAASPRTGFRCVYETENAR